jgi:hypothetical protein
MIGVADMTEIILGAGAIAGATTAIIIALVMIIKPIRKRLYRAFGTNKAQLALLRNEITAIYYEHLPQKVLPAYVRRNLIMLNEAYVEVGGNCYVAVIFKDMMGWEVSSKA